MVAPLMVAPLRAATSISKFTMVRACQGWLFQPNCRLSLFESAVLFQ
jgi:hypothetical protein